MLSVERAEMNENGRTISSLNIDTNFPKKKKQITQLNSNASLYERIYV